MVCFIVADMRQVILRLTQFVCNGDFNLSKPVAYSLIS